MRTRCAHGRWVAVANSECPRRAGGGTGSNGWTRAGSVLRSESVSIFGTAERGFFEPLVKPLAPFRGSQDQWDKYLVDSRATVHFFFGGCPEWKWKSGSGVCVPFQAKSFRPFEGRTEGTTWHVAIMDARSWQVHLAVFPGPLPAAKHGGGPLLRSKAESFQ